MNATGWGLVADYATSIPPILRSVSVPTISNQQCADYYSNDIITGGILCVNTTGGKGTCFVRFPFSSILFLKLSFNFLNIKF